MKFHRHAILMAAAEAATGAAGAAASTEVPSTNAEGAAPTAKVRAPKNPENILDIVNGRLPLPLVFLIRFKTVGATVADTAKKFGTSVGKVFDINKGRNFGYVDASYKPSADEIAAAKKWLTEAKTNRSQKTLGELMGKEAVDALIKELDAMGTATADEVAKRGWAVRVVGAKKDAGTAPVATGAAPAVAAAAAAKPAGNGAKLFPG